MKDLTFRQLREAGIKRCEKHFHKVNEWSPSDWATALAGEVGEACNFIKKIRRLKSKHFKGDKSRKHKKELYKATGKEIADALCYLDLLAARMGFQLDDLVKQKFNEVSDRVGSKIKL